MCERVRTVNGAHRLHKYINLITGRVSSISVSRFGVSADCCVRVGARARASTSKRYTHKYDSGIGDIFFLGFDSYVCGPRWNNVNRSTHSYVPRVNWTALQCAMCCVVFTRLQCNVFYIGYWKYFLFVCVWHFFSLHLRLFSCYRWWYVCTSFTRYFVVFTFFLFSRLLLCFVYLVRIRILHVELICELFIPSSSLDWTGPEKKLWLNTFFCSWRVSRKSDS